jgi:hypothetical protein
MTDMNEDPCEHATQRDQDVMPGTATFALNPVAGRLR